MVPIPGTPRQTGRERREAILEAAVHEIAVSGFAGATTAAIARRAGISQPYVFRFFPTKKDLALAVIEHTQRRILATWDQVEPEPGQDRLTALGRAYVRSISGRRAELLVQLHGYAAASDPDIAAALRRCLGEILEYVAALLRREGVADPEGEAARFVARGFLINAAMAIGLESTVSPEQWRAIVPVTGIARIEDLPTLGAEPAA